MFTGFPDQTSFSFVPLSPSRRTRSVPSSIPIPAVSSQLLDASCLNRVATSRSIWVLIVIALAAARNGAPFPLNRPKIPSPCISTYRAENRSNITAIALMKYVYATAATLGPLVAPNFVESFRSANTAVTFGI